MHRPSPSSKTDDKNTAIPIIYSNLIQRLLDSSHNIVGLGETQIFQIESIRSRHVHSSNSNNRCVQVEEGIRYNLLAALLSMMILQISAPIPHWPQPSSTVTSLLVFLTLSMIVFLSRGRIDLKFITSTLMPSLASSSAA